MLINKPKQLEDFCAKLRAAGAPVGFDTEFMSERRYFARLCLVQVHAQTPEGDLEALIDPFAVELDPLLEILTDENIVKIVHSGGQDLQIFWVEYGKALRNVFDTQIAAAFLGFGHQAGYADLVRRAINGPQLSKKMQFTDWSARPLTQEQQEYALADVLHLPLLYNTLKSDLEKRERFAWAQSEFRRAEEKACRVADDSELYRKFNLSGLNRRQLGNLRELAAAREILAREADKPPSFIVPELALLQAAKEAPINVAAWRGIRGMPGMGETQSRVFITALERSAQLSNEELPERNHSERPDPQTDNIAVLLGVVAQQRALTNDIARPYFAPRDQITALAAWWLKSDGSPLPDLPILTGWRRELLGNELLDLLNGRRAIALDAAGESAIRVVEVKA
jgi:ribonuclease D